MKYRITEENENYDISVIFQDKNTNEEIKMGDLLIDTKRGNYYILPCEDYSDEISKSDFRTLMINVFLSRLCNRINAKAMSGEVKSYSKDIIRQLALEYKMESSQTEIFGKEENLEDRLLSEYYEDLGLYYKGLKPEGSMFGTIR